MAEWKSIIVKAPLQHHKLPKIGPSFLDTTLRKSGEGAGRLLEYSICFVHTPSFQLLYHFEEKWRGGGTSARIFNLLCAYTPSLFPTAVAFRKNSSFIECVLREISGDRGQHTSLHSQNEQQKHWRAVNKAIVVLCVCVYNHNQ